MLDTTIARFDADSYELNINTIRDVQVLQFFTVKKQLVYT